MDVWKQANELKNFYEFESIISIVISAIELRNYNDAIKIWNIYHEDIFKNLMDLFYFEVLEILSTDLKACIEVIEDSTSGTDIAERLGNLNIAAYNEVKKSPTYQTIKMFNEYITTKKVDSDLMEKNIEHHNEHYKDIDMLKSFEKRIRQVLSEQLKKYYSNNFLEK